MILAFTNGKRMFFINTLDKHFLPKQVTHNQHLFHSMQSWWPQCHIVCIGNTANVHMTYSCQYPQLFGPINKSLISKLKSKGITRLPWLTPLPTKKNSKNLSFHSTRIFCLVYHLASNLTKEPGAPTSNCMSEKESKAVWSL